MRAGDVEQRRRLRGQSIALATSRAESRASSYWPVMYTRQYSSSSAGSRWISKLPPSRTIRSRSPYHSQ